jgi:hypothetical protein
VVDVLDDVGLLGDDGGDDGLWRTTAVMWVVVAR